MSTAAKLKELRARANLSMAEAAERMDLKRASSYQYYESDTGYGRDRFPPHIISKLKVAFVGLGDPPITPDDIDELDRAPPSDLMPMPDAAFAAGANTADRAIIRDMLKTAYGLEFVRVPLYDMASQECIDALLRGLNSPASYFVDSAWFAASTGRPREGGAFLMMAGDTMEPTIRAGDTLFVDRTVKAFTVEGVYVVIIAGTIALRRCVRDTVSGALRMHVDNPQYPFPDKGIAPPETIVGRVTWCAQSW